MMLSRKIKLNPNKKQREYINRAIGVARFTYNWIVGQFNENLEKGIWIKPLELKKVFNSKKREEFPFVMDVTKYASQQPFINFGKALDRHRKKKGGRPHFHKKKHKAGSFYIGGDQIKVEYCSDSKRSYLKIPKLPKIRMRENSSLNGHINGVVISRLLDDYYVSISYDLDSFLKERISSGSIGIDLGLTSFLALSNCVLISSIRALSKYQKQLRRAQRQLSKRQHPKNKDDVRNGVKSSNNFLKLVERIVRIHKKIANTREDFLHKLSTHIVKYYKYIAIEDLDVKALLGKKKLSKFISDASWSKFINMLKYKAAIYGSTIFVCDRFLASTKMCSNCGAIKEYMSLETRSYDCANCGMNLDRDYNASLNLLNAMKQKIGKALPELTPAEMQSMLKNLQKNNLAYSIVEPGIKTKSL